MQPTAVSVRPNNHINNIKLTLLQSETDMKTRPADA